MATHWATETKEKVNHAKLCRLLYDGGGTALRSVVDGHCSSGTLVATLKAEEPQLLKLKKRKVLNIDQWNKLYPPSGTSPSTKDFDITLLFVLIRNICGFTKPATGWDDLPPPTDKSTEANLARIKCYRNKVIHAGNAVDDIQYEAYWKDISSALVSLGLKQDDIDDLKARPFGAADYFKLLKEWQLAETDIKDQLCDIKSSIASVVTGFTNIGEQISQIQKSTTPSETDKLFHQEFRSHISSKCNLYHPNTRAWILEKVKAHVESDSNEALVIQAGPGMGKSVLAARICQTYQDSQENQSILGACHFFQHNDLSRNNPRLMLQSVAWQLCGYLPEYKVAVEKVLQSDHMRNRDISVLSCTELFTLLFEEPFSHLGHESTGKLVVVIDALDECCNSLKKEFFQVIRDRLYSLPSWIRFVMTTRPPPSISSQVLGNTTEIDPKDFQNTEDLQRFFADKLKEVSHLSSDQQQPGHLEQLVDLTGGLFLVASFVIDFLNKTNIHSLTEALERFPKGKGITSVYEDYFSRLHDEITPHLKSEEGFYNMLDAVVKAKSPIEKNIFYDILGFREESRIPDSKKKEAINLLHQLFPVENDHVSPFHKTVIDWLTTGDHDFAAQGDGSDVLASACYDALMNIQREISRNPNPPTQLTDKESFAFDFGFDYMEESQSFNERKTHAIIADPYVLCTEASCYLPRNNFDENEFYLANGFYKKAFAERLPADLQPIYYQIQIFLGRNPHSYVHECSVQKLTFLQCLEFAFRALNLLKIETEDSVFHYLKENCLPYHERETILQLKLASPKVVTEVLPSDDGFFLGQYWDGQTIVKKYHHDGTFINEVQLDEIYNLTLSPDYKSIVAWYRINSISDNIDIRNVDALGKVTSYKLPNFIKSLHVFGSQWYIVARCFDNMIYIVEGDTGRLVGDPCAVQQNENVLCVSNVGHILLTKTSIAMFSDILDHAFTDEEKRICFQMLLTQRNEALDRRDTVSCELFLCNYKELNKRIPIYFRHLRCRCSTGIVGREPISKLTYPGYVLFSEDGHLLAFYYADCITIVRTSDGSLYTSVCLCYPGYIFGHYMKILYLSETGIIIKGQQNIVSFSFTGESRPRDVAFDHVYFFPEDPDRICFFVSRSSKNPKELWSTKKIQYNQGEVSSYYALSIQKYMFFDQ